MPVTYRHFPGQFHGFFTMGKLLQAGQCRGQRNRRMAEGAGLIANRTILTETKPCQHGGAVETAPRRPLHLLRIGGLTARTGLEFRLLDDAIVVIVVVAVTAAAPDHGRRHRHHRRRGVCGRCECRRCACVRGRRRHHRGRCGTCERASATRRSRRARSRRGRNPLHPRWETHRGRGLGALDFLAGKVVCATLRVDLHPVQVRVTGMIGSPSGTAGPPRSQGWKCRRARPRMPPRNGYHNRYRWGAASGARLRTGAEGYEGTGCAGRDQPRSPGREPMKPTNLAALVLGLLLAGGAGAAVAKVNRSAGLSRHRARSF